MTVGRLLWLPSVLRGAGLTVIEHPGWQTRGADKILARMDPLFVGGHHTATSSAWLDTAVENLLANGRPGIPGPLSHLGLRRSAVYVCIASGVANHAGTGSWKNVSGNKRSIGIEAYNAGNGETWPKIQLEAYDRGVAAILKHLGRDASNLWGHKEWATPPGRKIDPYGINMAAMRLRVQGIMEEDDMTLTQARIEIASLWHIKAGVWMTPQGSETAQMRLTRLAQEVVDKVRTAQQIVDLGAPVKPGPSDPAEKVPAWVVDPTILV